jgi:hypothetical protein
MAGPAAVRLCVDTTETDGGGYDILRWNIRSRLRGRFGDRQHRKATGVLEIWRESSIAVRAAPIYCDYPVGSPSVRSLQTTEIMHAPVYTEALMVWSRLGLLRRSLPVSCFHPITDDGG